MTKATSTRLGMTIGIHGWLVGTVIFCLAGGHYAVVGEILAIGLPVSVAMSALAILLMESVQHRVGRGRTLAFSLWGLILFVVGVLILLLNHWLAPLIDQTPGLAEQLTRLGAVYMTHDVVPALCLIASAVLLSLCVRGCLRTR